MSAIALTLLAVTQGFSDTLISPVELTDCTRCFWLKLRVTAELLFAEDGCGNRWTASGSWQPVHDPKYQIMIM